MDKSLEAHFDEFKTDGFTLFKGMLDEKWVREMIDSFEEIRERLQLPEGVDQNVLTNVLD